MTARPLLTAVVTAPETGAAGTFAIMDVLLAVGRHWNLLHGAKPAEPYFSPRLLTVDGAPYRPASGVTITPHGALADYPRPDLVIVPELTMQRHQPVPDSYAPIIDYLRAAHASGAVVATVCSGALLLAASGLLDGEEATTHWGYCDMLRRNFPKVRLRGERILVPAGTGHRLITAGGSTSWYDLLLYLIARFAGADEARRVARVFLLQSHSQGQLPFAGLTAKRQHEDEAIRSAQLWIADNYRAAHPVGLLAARCGLTERGFHARFRRATGMAPMDYIQTVRIEEAKQLLETTDAPVDDVAEQVGYLEPASLRRLFRRMVGLTPSAYRRQRLLPTP